MQLKRVLLGLAACTALGFSQLSSAQVDDLQEAGKLLRAGQHSQALERVNRALAAKPRDAQARFMKGLILTEQGNTKEAVEIFQKLTQDFPDLPEPYNNLAVIYASQGQYDKARASLEQSIRTHPSYATAYENLGDVYAKLASQAYDKALQLDSSNSAAQNKLALVRELVGGAPRGGAAAVAAARSKPAAASPSAPVPSTPAPAEPRPAAPVAVASAPAAEARAAADKPPADKAAPARSAGVPGEVLKSVEAWAAAWAKKDVDGYLAYYARDFKAPNGDSRKDWAQGRRERILAPKSISVGVESPRITMTGDNQASVTFRQKYRSDLRTISSTKTLVLVKSNDGRWLIQQERVGS
jgi:tetratricopeptide (TPR) repeat protein